MTDEPAGWHPHPNAAGNPETFPLVEPGRVAGLGALCDLGSTGVRSQSFSVSEFVLLEDGRRVVLHAERGFTAGWNASAEPSQIRAHLRRDTIIRDVLTVVLPDDDEPAEDHPYEWLAELARARGLTVTADDLRGLGYDVELSDELEQWLS